MESLENKKLTGNILISEPFLKDSYFSRAVVLLADHSSEGAFGVIINKPFDIKVSSVLINFPDFNFPLYLGGPVKDNSVFFIHTLGKLIPNSYKITDGLFWGGDFNELKSLNDENLLNNETIRFFVGYSGWDPNQLEEELSDDTWITTKITSDEIMRSEAKLLWSKMVKKMGENYIDWINYPVDPLLN